MLPRIILIGYGKVVGLLASALTGRRADTFNISVDGNENYFVGEQGVLVHYTNSLCDCGAGASNPEEDRLHLDVDAEIERLGREGQALPLLVVVK